MIRIGILMGGISREREISFAGGRTVFDNLDRSRFVPIPIFIDSFGLPVLLDWQFLYKGTIRDFYPPPQLLGTNPYGFQYYIEQLTKSGSDFHRKALRAIGQPLEWNQVRSEIDFAFLTLHGEGGEDGTIQGLLELHGIPYSGSGILGSAIGIDKVRQKPIQRAFRFATANSVVLPAYELVADDQALAQSLDQASRISLAQLTAQIADSIGFPCVLKHPTQGSSIGVQIIRKPEELAEKWAKVCFRKTIVASELADLPPEALAAHAQQWADLRTEVGLPAWATSPQMTQPAWVQGPDDLLELLMLLQSGQLQSVTLQALDFPSQILVEEFLSGTEFSAIVVEDETGQAVALPPTEIVKQESLFDYRDKYLPGRVNKRTPILLDTEALLSLCAEAQRMKDALQFDVYARLDGILGTDGRVYFNDPNTTSGMLPSSFFFHQAAEIGLNPTAFLTYIIHTSLRARAKQPATRSHTLRLLQTWDSLGTLSQHKSGKAKGKPKLPPQQKPRIGVVLGGYSTERHISVESGRNIYEKLSSAGEYQVLPLFLLHNDRLDRAGLGPQTDPDAPYSLWELPIALLLKDNADDIAQKIVDSLLKPEPHPGLMQLRQRAEAITDRYSHKLLDAPRPLRFASLRQHLDFAFIALHGRPGEDGDLQQHLERAGIPYNGSDVTSSQLTINKYETNCRLRENGFRVPAHYLVQQQAWKDDKAEVLDRIEGLLAYPIIAKPADEGCSSAVKRLRDRADLLAYAQLCFRTEELPTGPAAERLHVLPNDPFPPKAYFLVEELVSPQSGWHQIEVTVGLLTKLDAAGKRHYEVFEPSETLAQGGILTLEEKFLAGEGQNITPAQYLDAAHAPKSADVPQLNRLISQRVREEIRRAAEVLDIEGYARIDAFVRFTAEPRIEVIFIEVNSLPGMTPATCIFHQAALAGYTPLDFIKRIIAYGLMRHKMLED
jgi:D-alanine-D-alanine ligase